MKLNLDIFDRPDEKQDWTSAWAQAIKLSLDLSKSETEAHMAVWSTSKQNTEDTWQNCQDLASILTRLIRNDSAILTPRIFLDGIKAYNAIHNIFKLAGTDIDGLIQGLIKNQSGVLDDSAQRKLGLIITPATELDICPLYEKLEFPERALVLLNVFRKKDIYAQNAHENKIRLYQYRSDIENIPLELVNINQLEGAYFACSYIDYDQKHVIKENINTLIRKYFSRAVQLPDTAEEPPERERPKMAICIEHYKASHAFYRSWSKRLKALRDYFDVTLFTLAERYNDNIRDDFDDVFVFEKRQILAAFAKLVEMKPDIVFFPSIGMDITNITLSNFRFAPLQIMALGHPATTYSKHIDAVIAVPGLMDERAFPHEKLLCDPAAIYHTPSSYLDEIDLSRAADTAEKSKLNICIAGATSKLAAPFFEFLIEIENNPKIDAKFTFLCDSKGLDLMAFENFAKSHFKDVQIDGYQLYPAFFKKIEETDIALVPYPFGHCNTMIDSLLAKKPCVVYHGIEPHERSTVIVEQIGLTEDFVRDSHEKYKALFYTLAEQILAGKRDFFDPQTVYDRMYNKPQIRHSFCDSMKWVYENRHNILSSDDRVIKIPLQQ